MSTPPRNQTNGNPVIGESPIREGTRLVTTRQIISPGDAVPAGAHFSP
jgi:hypothetical protein